MAGKRVSKTAARQARRRGGVEPYPGGVRTTAERIEAGEPREEIASGRRKAAAIELGRKLVESMPGTGWRLHVWQNLGWHYSVRRGDLQVMPSSGGGYAAMFLGGDLNRYLPYKTYLTGAKAFQAVLKLARRYRTDTFEMMTAQIEGAEGYR